MHAWENYNVPTQGYDFMMMLSGTGAGFCDENSNYNLKLPMKALS